MADGPGATASGPNGYIKCTHYNSPVTIPASDARANLAFNTARWISVGWNSENSGDVSAFKTYLASQYSGGTPVKFVYKLADEQTYQLTPQEVTTLLGDNNIFADTGNVELTYRASLDGYVDDKLSASQALMELLITANRETGTTASKAYTAGDLVIIDGTLYSVASNIANGGTFTVGTNVVATTIAAQLAALS